ncbi:lysophospholipid acyltransferase family protein [Mucilaginibacter jinjuensis]|uniref:Lysophospholipid acyltransferase family protein n=1 Tax=Mucilaginibacter jinjuensis TaxID=1176721 RepID=A0ABY7T1I3_9SPHI|nr:lysophospholipid acyltransferase family protein [Mucilaginibacter jinjuensis]WCT10113.1 lysophospholipid acyltransferase family protein [Mucilaginibacter jinjuensis]
MIKKGLTSLAIFFLYLLSLLPFWFLYLIADFLYLILFYIAGYRRAVVQENLRNSFPEKTEDERKIIEKKYFHYLADLFVETIKAISMTEKQVKRRMYLLNEEVVQHYFEQNRSIVAVVGHYGNWEWGALRTSFLTNHRRIIIYKPLHDKASDELYKKVRSKFGVTLVTMKATLRKMVEYRNELSISVFASDQTPVREEAHFFTPFLNQPTAVFLGIEKIATLFNSVVIFADIRRVKRGYYQCTFVPLIEEPKQTAEYQITEAHVQYLEKVIREEPPYWLWSHRRWKFKPE